MACSYNLVQSKTWKTATVTSTGDNKGTASLKCNDGYWQVQSQSCNMHCDNTFKNNIQKWKNVFGRVGKKAHNTVVGGFKNDDIRNNGEIKGADDGIEIRKCNMSAKHVMERIGQMEIKNVDTSMSGTEGGTVNARDTNYTSYGKLSTRRKIKCRYSTNDTKGKGENRLKWLDVSYNGACGSGLYECSTYG